MAGAGISEDVVRQLYAAAQLLVITAARPVGFATFFSVFAWGRLNAGLLRIAFGLVLALPAIAPLWVKAPDVVEALPAPLVVIVAKEAFIGILMGLAASLPFEALVGAGAVADSVRGATSPLSTSAGEVTPFGQLFVVIGVTTFVGLGGFWLIGEIMMESYRVWAPVDLLPSLTLQGAGVFALFLSRFFQLALLLAGPIVLALFAADIVLSVAAKLGKRVDITFLTVSVNNLIAVVLLPLIAMSLVRAFGSEVGMLRQIMTLLDSMIR